MGDNIKKPDHYCEGREYEPKDVIRDWGLNFNLGSAVKYISRAGRKGDKVEDLKKAKQFLEFEIEAVEEEKEKASREAFYKSIDALDECKARLSGKDKMEQEATAKVKKRFVDLNTGKDICLMQEQADTFTFSFKEETEQEEVLSLADIIGMIMKDSCIPEPDVINLHFKFEDDPTAIPTNTVSIKFHINRKEI